MSASDIAGFSGTQWINLFSELLTRGDDYAIFRARDVNKRPAIQVAKGLNDSSWAQLYTSGCMDVVTQLLQHTHLNNAHNLQVTISLLRRIQRCSNNDPQLFERAVRLNKICDNALISLNSASLLTNADETNSPSAQVSNVPSNILSAPQDRAQPPQPVLETIPEEEELAQQVDALSI